MALEIVRILVLSTSASSSAMLVALVLRKPMRYRFGAHAAYALWILVPVSALVFVLPAPTASLSMSVVPTAVTAFVSAMPTAALPSAIVFDPSWLAGAWLLGVGFVCLLFVRQQRRFVQGLGQLSTANDETLRAQATAGCPALLGAWRPRVVVPADFETRYSSTERELILAHERTHRARGDAQINAVAAVLRCAFWFNPLIHFVASRFRFDQELACDAVIISRFPEARRSYADAMLKTQLAIPGLPVGCHWQSSHPLKERIAMLKKPLPGRTRAALGAGVAIALIVGGTYAAWAVQPPTPVPQSQAAKVAEAAVATPSDTSPTEDVTFRRSDAPKYPKAAIDAHQSGRLILKVQVDEKGNVLFAEVEKADPSEAKAVFAQTSLAAVMQWKFNPARKNGKPVPGWVHVPIDFTLTDDEG